MCLSLPRSPTSRLAPSIFLPPPCSFSRGEGGLCGACWASCPGGPACGCSGGASGGATIGATAAPSPARGTVCSPGRGLFIIAGSFLSLGDRLLRRFDVTSSIGGASFSSPSCGESASKRSCICATPFPFWIISSVARLCFCFVFFDVQSAFEFDLFVLF